VVKSNNDQIVELFFNLPSRSKGNHRIGEPTGHRDHSTVWSNTDIQECEVSASVDLIWTWLAEIADPEIPVISLVDLGIIRQVNWLGDLLIITITPTYSGCPATRVIQDDIEQHLHKRGISRLRLERQLSPAWTTDWISAAGREKLQRYGIAPPQQGVSGTGNGATGASVICPRCQSNKTRKVSQFGSTPCKANYQCTDCLEPFDYFKCL
jgi:ring-1,2-phenylacetyl-CoA epoxidase subunit PaaD